MRLRLLGTALGLVLVPGALVSSALFATNQEKRIVAKVGSVEITAQDLEERLRKIPPFQLQSLGRTPKEIKREFLEQAFINEALFIEGSRARKLTDQAETRRRIAGALRLARLSELRADAAKEGVSRDEILEYYALHKAKFEAPERILVWRILCESKEEAARILEDAKKAGTVERWEELAREHSLDKATAMRGGNLGYLSPDGSSQFQGVKVDSAIVEAAKKLDDGAFGTKPIAEGEQFAIIWRRGSMPAVERSVEDEIESIGQVLWRQKLESAKSELVGRLREKKVRDVNPALVELLEVDSNADMGLRKRPGVVQKPASGSPAPQGEPGKFR